MKSSLASLLCSAVISCTLTVVAAEKKSDPTGTWTSSYTTANGETRETKLKLKAEGEKLTGAIIGRDGNEMAIEKGTFKDEKISFQVTRERNGNTTIAKVNAAVAGDQLKGTLEFDDAGETRKIDWDAKRSDAPKAGASVTGDWKYTFTTANGQTFEPTLKLKQDGNKVTGAVSLNENELAIQDGAIKDGEISFQLVWERDGQKLTSKYQGKLEGEGIKGKITSNWSGTERTYDFEAKKVKVGSPSAN